jgi:hypothetical protein
MIPGRLSMLFAVECAIVVQREMEKFVCGMAGQSDSSKNGLCLGPESRVTARSAISRPLFFTFFASAIIEEHVVFSTQSKDEYR